MHYVVWVLGPEPVERAYACLGPYGVNWCAIGGRYTGQLIAWPGAQSAVTYGDAMPPEEVRPLMQGFQRFQAAQGPGVDQVRLAELDARGTMDIGRPPYWLIDRDNSVHNSGLSNELDLYLMNAELNPELRQGDTYDSIWAILEEWGWKIIDLCAAAPEDTLLTVVDASGG